MRNLFFGLLLITTAGFSQEGNPIKTIAFPRVDAPQPDKKPETTTTAPQYSISKPFEPKLFKFDKKTYEEPSLPKTTGMGNQPKSDLDVGKQYVKKLTKEYEKEFSGDVKKENIYFGEIKTKSDFIVLMCRDYGEIDFDYVSLEVGETIVSNRILLSSDFRVNHVNLVKGKNRISYTALNEGEMTPNTAEFKILDDKNNVLYDSQWALKKEYKAIIDIIKE